MLIASGLAGGRRILELMNRENNLDQNLTGHADEMIGEIEFRNVSFGYEGKEPVLDKVTFKVKPGQTVAIVGQTGSSKTTLAKLINRTYDVTRGKVMVDGVDVRDWNLESLRRNISIIEQDIFLFSRSISDNIAFGKQHAGKQEIEKAARAAQADEFIRSFKKDIKPSSVNVGSPFPVGSGSAWRWRAPSSPTRASWCWMIQPAPSTALPRI